MTTKTKTASLADASADASVPVAGAWVPDILPGYERRTLPLTATPEAGEPDEPLFATLVRKAGVPAHARAVLYVHGWNDYFFQTHVVDWFDEHGWTVYALDLRRYGRSLREGQLPGYVASLDDYFEELDAALALIEPSHEGVLLLGHSTGGLTASLWAHERPGRLVGVVLNSPWFDLGGPTGLASALRPVLGTLSRRDPHAILPLPEGDPIYARTLHVSYGGEWDYSLELKSTKSVPIRVGWLQAVLRGQARVAKGLDIDCPVFMATSATSWFGRRFSPKARISDVVLDVSRITAHAWRLGRVVTTVRIPGGVHDLFLSRASSRRRLFDDLELWLGAYVR